MTDLGDVVLVYLDHQILDSFIKERQLGLRRLLSDVGVQVIYSNENLNEISRSTGFEQQFLLMLDELKARHFRVILDDRFRDTGKAIVDDRKSSDVYSEFLANKKDSPPGDFGFTEMLGKFYGGHSNRTYQDIFSSGARDITKLLEEAKIDLRDESLPGGIDRETCERAISDFQQILPAMFSKLGKQLTPVLGDTPIRKIEDALELGPRELQSIRGPGALQKIWESISEKIPRDSTTLEKFFGIVSSNENDRSERTVIEKVNAIYHQLNVIGYYRDSKMHKDRRFRASMSDMTHAGLASFSNVFVCFDEDLSRKAQAAYEYLGTGPVLFPEYR